MAATKHNCHLIYWLFMKIMILFQLLYIILRMKNPGKILIILLRIFGGSMLGKRLFMKYSLKICMENQYNIFSHKLILVLI